MAHRTHRFVGWTIVVGLALCAAACGARQHLSDNFGVRQRAVFAAQTGGTADPLPAAVTGEEAAIILQRYRQALEAGSAMPTGPGRGSRPLDSSAGMGGASSEGGFVFRSR